MLFVVWIAICVATCGESGPAKGVETDSAGSARVTVRSPMDAAVATERATAITTTVPCYEGSAPTDCRNALEQFLKTHAERRILGVLPIEYRVKSTPQHRAGTEQLIVIHADTGRWPRADSLRVQEIPCAVQKPFSVNESGPEECLASIRKMLSTRPLSIVTWIPITEYDNRSSRRGTRRILTLDNWSQGTMLSVTELPCRIRIDHGQTLFSRVDAQGVKWCRPALEEFMRDRPEERIAAIIPVEYPLENNQDKVIYKLGTQRLMIDAGTQRLLILHSRTGSWPFASSLRVDSRTCFSKSRVSDDSAPFHCSNVIDQSSFYVLKASAWFAVTDYKDNPEPSSSRGTSEIFVLIPK